MFTSHALYWSWFQCISRTKEIRINRLIKTYFIRPEIEEIYRFSSDSRWVMYILTRFYNKRQFIYFFLKNISLFYLLCFVCRRIRVIFYNNINNDNEFNYCRVPICRANNWKFETFFYLLIFCIYNLYTPHATPCSSLYTYFNWNYYYFVSIHFFDSLKYSLCFY